MRVLTVVCASVLWLYACTQLPEKTPSDEDVNDIYRCYPDKDGTLLICPEKIKPKKVARG
jgi:hypothetical protein